MRSLGYLYFVLLHLVIADAAVNFYVAIIVVLRGQSALGLVDNFN
jgi:hypothetical protein